MQVTTFLCDNCGNGIPDPTTRTMIKLDQVGCNPSSGDLCMTCVSVLTSAMAKLPMPKAWATPLKPIP